MMGKVPEMSVYSWENLLSQKLKGIKESQFEIPDRTSK